MRKTAQLCAAVVAALACPLLRAADNAATGTTELAEVIVTAEKVERNLQKTAISIQTYSGEELKKSGKRRIDEIMAGVVGVSLEDGAIGAGFYMRGVDRGMGFGAPGGAPDTPTVSVLIDGVYQNRGETVRGGTLDVAQVEVMRGSQGTTLGASALAGAVSLVTNKPVFDFQASGTAEVGNYNTLNTEGVLNVPLADNQALRVAYSSNKRNGFISSNAGESDLVNARLKYRWKISDKVDLVATVSRNRIGGNGNAFGQLLVAGHWVPYSGQTFPNAAGVATNLYPTTGSCNIGGNAVGAVSPLVPVFRNDASNNVVFNGAVGTAISARGCPATFVAVNDRTWYFDRRNPWDDGFPKDGYSVQAQRTTVVDDYATDLTYDTKIGTFTASPSVQRAEFRSIEPPDGGMAEHRIQTTRQLDARLASPSDSRLSWVGGINYYYTNNAGTSRNRATPGSNAFGSPAVGAGNLPPLVGSTLTQVTNAAGTLSTQNPACPFNAATLSDAFCYSWLDQPRDILETKSVYANLTYPIVDRFRLLGGVRYQTDFKETAGTQDGVLAGNSEGFIDNPALRYDFSGKWSNTQYRVGLEYDVRPQSMLYATYQTGYQPGGVNLTMGGMVGAQSDVSVTGSSLGNPLKLKQFTLGIKNRFLDNRLQVNVEAWNSEFKDRTANFDGVTQLIGDGTLANSTVCANNTFDSAGLFRAAITATDACLIPGANITGTLADQVSRGVDLEINFLPTADDRIDWSVERLDAHYDSAPHRTGEDTLPAPTVANILAIAAFPGATGAAHGAAPANAAAQAQKLVDAWNAAYGAYPGFVLSSSAKWSSTLSYSHTFHFANGSTIQPRVAGAYRSDFWTSGGGGNATVTQLNASLKDSSLPLVPGVQRAYVKWDAFTTWTRNDGKFSITGYMRNVANKATIVNASLTSVSLDQPRTFGVIVTGSL